MAAAFQVNAFQNSAFQTLTTFAVGANAYSVGSPAFATPVLTRIIIYSFAASSYAVASPAFAAPALHQTHKVSANGYFVSPSFAELALHQTQKLTAASYSLGSPAFAVPALLVKYGLGAPVYVIGNPAFATPALSVKYTVGSPAYATGSPRFASPGLDNHPPVFLLEAVDYVLGALAIAKPAVGQFNGLTVANYAIASPAFAKPLLGSRYALNANASGIGSPDFAKPAMKYGVRLAAAPYATGPIAWSPVGIFTHPSVLQAAPYSLGSPSFGFPRLQWRIVDVGYPPSYITQVQAASTMLQTLLNLLLRSIPSTATGTDANEVRRLIGAMRANAEEAIRGTTLGTDLQAIYDAATAAGSTYAGVEAARQFLMTQTLSNSLSTQIVCRSALLMTLALESKVIAAIKFTTQADAQAAILHARDMFDQAKAVGIDEVDVLTYQALNAMGGALINHLAATQLQLPRFVSYATQMPMPSLYLANRIYADASRSDEIEEENGVIHPAFCPVNLRVLSNVGRPNRF